MGHGSWSSNTYAKYTTDSNYDSKSINQIFTSTKIDQMLNPLGVGIRESRDSTDNPNSTPIIIALDETGSMGSVIEQMARHGLNQLVTQIHQRKPVLDPHVLCMGIGDIECDHYPLQVSQFEADLRILQQLEKIYLEGNGGGNSHESYTLPWYFARYHTSTDSFEKRNKKGYLFTVGDERPNPDLTQSRLKQILGVDQLAGPTNSKELLDKVLEQWEVFHIIVAEGSYASRYLKAVQNEWQDLLGQRAITLPDHKKMAEVIIAAIENAEGKDPSAGWDPETAAIINAAVKNPFGHKLEL